MMKSFVSLALLATATMLPAAASAEPAARPMFGVMPPHGTLPARHAPVTPIAQWNGSYTDLKSHTVSYTMIGADPATSNVTTTIQVEIIPVIVKYTKASGKKGKFDPTKDKDTNNKTIINNILASPLFDSSNDWVQGGTDLGQAQYIDAYQRANFWTSVSTNTAYHTVLSVASVLKPLKIKVTSTAQGKIVRNPFGTIDVGEMTQGLMDSKIHAYISSHTADITPNTFPFFISDNIYLTSGGCCIGGYHSTIGAKPNGQTYGYTTYVTEPGSFSQDIDAASHEIGEWLDDPFISNHVFCTDNSIMENGDPLVNGFAAFGTFPLTLNGFTYHPQDLVFIDYFGAPTSIPLHSWYSFQNQMTHVCPGQN